MKEFHATLLPTAAVFPETSFAGVMDAFADASLRFTKIQVYFTKDPKDPFSFIILTIFQYSTNIYQASTI